MANLPQNPYVDGWFGSEQELSVAPNPLFPFAIQPTPDKYSRGYGRNYQITPRVYVPKIATRNAWTNLLTYSQDLTNAAWTKTNVTPTIVATPVAPDGNATLNKLLESSSNAEHSAAQAATVTAAAQEIYCFAQSGLNRDWIRLLFTDSASATFSAFFNITNGYVYSASAGVTAFIVPLGDGQFQCGIRFTPAAGSGTLKANISTDGSTVSYVGDTAKGVYVWGFSVALGSSVPYIATTSVTRAISSPIRDKVDPLAFLCLEVDPNLQNSQAAVVARTFFRVPIQQVVQSDLSINKPAISTLGQANNFETIISGVQRNIGAGYTYNNYDWPPNRNEVYGPMAATTVANSGGNTRVTWSSPHGITGTEWIASGGVGPSGNAIYIVAPSDYSVVSTTVIDILGFNNVGGTLSSKILRNYTPGLSMMRCKVVSDFYLPGVTVGITTADDIPIPGDLLNPATFIAAATANVTGYVTYQLKSIQQWKQTPIWQRDILQINFADL